MYAIITEIEGEEFARVLSYGFLTTDGVEEEIEWLEENGQEGTEYDSVEYDDYDNPAPYYIDGADNLFARTASGARDMV